MFKIKSKIEFSGDLERKVREHVEALLSADRERAEHIGTVRKNLTVEKMGNSRENLTIFIKNVAQSAFEVGLKKGEV